jgi:hypothetical protein
MVDRGGWAESDAVAVLLVFFYVSDVIGLAVRERRCFAAAFCH